ncbi:MAG: hypothetical protein AVO39_05420 [delta proteobacterium MLS_D]|jgi:putative component of membrane protein insertase Oxa1/YidC/SpoIIIJ protein YidD|nr:MAG: hypothetical protein AVO39_05420 [delta proteobacterium MLS_D]
MKTVLLLTVVAVGMFFVSPGGEAGEAPWDFNTGPEAAASGHEEKPSSELEGTLLRGFRTLLVSISRVDGDRCPMYPTCSAYSIAVFKRYGFIKGFVMTFDRVMRCGGNTLDMVPLTDKGYYDPPERNDFYSTPSDVYRAGRSGMNEQP